MKYDYLKEFYEGKKVLVTGHTGFKGSWMCMVLLNLGADVIGYSLNPPTNPNLFNLIGLEKKIKSYIGDIRDLSKLKEVFYAERPNIVIHMAAQPLVIESYNNPSYTYDVNVMGTVNVLECIRESDSVISFVNVTTDKVYRNTDDIKEFVEDDILDGMDPYSNSKSCSELVTACYKRSFFDDSCRIAVSTCRAGNVIGGGDFADNRILPDCVRAALQGEDIIVRNPFSVRPYQHVLESIIAYLIIAMEQSKNFNIAGSYNIGPDKNDIISTGELVDLFVNIWNKDKKNKIIKHINIEYNGPKESLYLRLNNSKFINTFECKARWNIQEAVEKVIEWTIAYKNQEDIVSLMNHQILLYFE